MQSFVFFLIIARHVIKRKSTTVEGLSGKRKAILPSMGVKEKISMSPQHVFILYTFYLNSK